MFLPRCRKRLESSFHQDLWKKASCWKYLHQGTYLILLLSPQFLLSACVFLSKSACKTQHDEKIFFFIILKSFFLTWVGPICWKYTSKSRGLYFYENIVSFDGSNVTCKRSKFYLDADVNSQNCIVEMYINLLGEYSFWACSDQAFFFFFTL